MKKLLLTLCMALMAISASARFISEPSMQGESAIGAHVLFATKFPNPGVGLRYSYFIVDHVRAELMFDYLFKNKGYTMWDINANAHYVWNIGESFRIYPLVGVFFASWKDHPLDDIDNRVGVNVGAGIQLKIVDNLWLGAEAKMQEMRHYHQGVFNLNATYCF